MGSYVVELQNADNVTLDHLRITGGYQGIYASNTSDSDHVTVSNSVIYGNYDRGVWLDTGNDFATITANEVYGIPGGTNVDDQYRGIYLAGTDGVVSNNLVHDGYYEGIFVNGLRNQVTGNQVYRFSTGISAYYGGSGADRIIVSGNIAHDNTSTGIYGYQYVLITGNTVYANNSAGISGDNIEVRGNTAYANYNGISATSGLIIDNTVYDNKNVGIDMENSVTVQRNRIFDNPYGLYMGYYASGDASGNLIYDNKLDGILVEEGYGGYSPRILNNTVYQPTAGNALRVQGSTKNLQVFNNIFWAGNGYALSVDPNSEVGFQSDYNLFYTPGSGKLGQWENRDFINRVDWFYEVGLDQHSRVADPLFADPDGADNILGYSSGGLTASFYNNETFTGPPVLTRLDDHVDYNWGGSPAAGRQRGQLLGPLGWLRIRARGRIVHLLHHNR